MFTILSVSGLSFLYNSVWDANIKHELFHNGDPYHIETSPLI